MGGSGLNLRSISGPTLNSDYFQTTDYPQAAGVLRALALGACQGTVSVIKQVIPPGGTVADATPAADWEFGATTSTAGLTIDPTSGLTDATGGINFGLTFPGGTNSAPVTVTETQQAGFTLVQQAGGERDVSSNRHPGSPFPPPTSGRSASSSPPIQPFRSAAPSTTRLRTRRPPCRSTSSGP